jgi:hypothetical protein
LAYRKVKIHAIFTGLNHNLKYVTEFCRNNALPHLNKRRKLQAALLLIVLFANINPLNAQLEDSLTELFYQQLYGYKFISAESTLAKIKERHQNDMIYEMVSINYSFWMLFTGKTDPVENDELLQRIECNIKRIESTETKKALSQENILQLIMLYSFQSRIYHKLDHTLNAVQTFRASYSYFKQMEPCLKTNCEVYNLVSGMYYVLTGYIRKDHPLIFYLAFDNELADINRGLSLLSQGVNSPILQIDIESRYFLMKLHAEVNDDPKKALVYANQLVGLFPENLTYRIYQLTLYHQLGKIQEKERAYSKFLELMKNNKQLTENQRKVLLAECHQSIGMRIN